jgi:hypothetical protein
MNLQIIDLKQGNKINRKYLGSWRIGENFKEK